MVSIRLVKIRSSYSCCGSLSCSSAFGSVCFESDGAYRKRRTRAASLKRASDNLSLLLLYRLTRRPVKHNSLHPSFARSRSRRRLRLVATWVCPPSGFSSSSDWRISMTRDASKASSQSECSAARSTLAGLPPPVLSMVPINFWVDPRGRCMYGVSLETLEETNWMDLARADYQRSHFDVKSRNHN